MLQAVRGLRCSLYQLQKAIKEDLASHVSLQRSAVRRDVANVEAGFVFNGTALQYLGNTLKKHDVLNDRVTRKDVKAFCAKVKTDGNFPEIKRPFFSVALYNQRGNGTGVSSG